VRDPARPRELTTCIRLRMAMHPLFMICEVVVACSQQIAQQ